LDLIQVRFLLFLDKDLLLSIVKKHLYVNPLEKKNYFHFFSREKIIKISCCFFLLMMTYNGLMHQKKTFDDFFSHETFLVSAQEKRKKPNIQKI